MAKVNNLGHKDLNTILGKVMAIKVGGYNMMFSTDELTIPKAKNMLYFTQFRRPAFEWITAAEKAKLDIMDVVLVHEHCQKYGPLRTMSF